jgi:hypothetical protein
MPKFQCVTTSYPEETGGLFRLNGRRVPRKRAVAQKASQTAAPESVYSEETGVTSDCPDQNCIAPRIVVGADT